MRKSSGILLYRETRGDRQYFLVHPGGPFWKGKEIGAWSIPKGAFGEGEDPLEAAIREFREETGSEVAGPFTPLEPVKQKGGKMVLCWAAAGDIDAAAIVSNTFRAEWPYRSGKWASFPEVDKAAWFHRAEALAHINSAQAAFIENLDALLGGKIKEAPSP